MSCCREKKIEWTGRPNPSVNFHQEDWLLIPFSMLWGGTFQWFGVIWGTPFVVIGQYLIWGRFLYQRWQKDRTYYALTDRRAVIVQKGIRGRSCSSAFLENRPMMDKRVRSDGIGDISFGGPVTGNWQWGRGKNPPRPPTFDDVDDANTVYQIAIRLQDRARKPDAPTRWGL